MLNQRTIVVTGAARGVGRDIAKACAAANARIILADILPDELAATVEDLRKSGADVRGEIVDISDPDAITSFATSIKEKEGSLHGLVNNAAIATNVGGKMFEDIDIDLWDRVQKVNVRGTWLMTKALAPLFDREGGQIVNVASDTALWGAPKLLAYVASKGAIISMTRSLARELGPRKIGVSAIAPGIMRNEATDYVPAERHNAYEEGRAVPGPQLPEDIVGVVTFLLTPAALPLTGQVLPVNAGFVFT